MHKSIKGDFKAVFVCFTQKYFCVFTSLCLKNIIKTSNEMQENFKTSNTKKKYLPLLTPGRIKTVSWKRCRN